ncbi:MULTISPECIES: LacI family DNA-binding transcriptional regulator [unclassified Exiguobacterium]|uniref:LacI family DNA-binding transcriptional regulator n=1 Tax=unclassified Exiguobacterium TaxID=2644629 RepID=UPI001040CDEA|nr:MULTISPECIES: LacI family DNA-binding transcriptional regulator [unclassified Exiguobacterium]TCI43519.1 LacI family transcriptional regulator [Exiguobacterium sp. SH5S32]TCI52466.1 LacI family transcriptional regulator [Exiguobacterium sp. SH1S4]TCI65238.1 LacI family transcriptional regulator [Exiguobacterium sp. SH0S2]TCI68774.1 LacI family transcriptional regulator [Exiguobacterium sp. SH1S1]TCI80341.1 LacI family transcriptional regulator [Exiguobacterium sp. SH0S1]
MKQVTINDIAKLAGVAKSTVSRYLNGGSVGKATREKIERVIRETKYEPNQFAQSLKSKQTKMIGVIVPRLDSYAASRTMMGIDERLTEHGYQMLVVNTAQQTEREIEQLYNLAKQKVAGIIWLGTTVTPAHLQAIEAIQIPVLLIGQQHDDVHSLVYPDNESAYALGRQFMEWGHRDIIYVGVAEDDIAVGQARRDGFLRAFNEAGAIVRSMTTTFRIDDAIPIGEQLATDVTDATLVVCATDNIALGVLKGLANGGKRVPDDISVSGFGGYDFTEVLHPSLTTVHLPYRRTGSRAADMILQLLTGEATPMKTFTNFELKLRESVDMLN